MITNFEDITTELNAQELLIVPVIASAFRKYTQSNPIKAPEICNRFNASGKYSLNLTEPRLRKIVNYIRCKSIIPLIATSRGYYVSDDVGVIQSQINSLTERANSIMECVHGLKQFIK